MSPTERRALLLLLSLGLAGQGVRWWAARPGEAPGQVELLAALPPRSPLAHRDSLLALARPLGPDERIDPDRATAAELARLPRVGPRLAKTIVADREARGPFGTLEALDRVPGIGPGLMATIGSHLAVLRWAGSASIRALRQTRCAPGGGPRYRPARRPPSPSKSQFRVGFRARRPARHRSGSRGGDLAGARGAGAVHVGRGAVPRAGPGPFGHRSGARSGHGAVTLDVIVTSPTSRHSPS